MLKKFFSIFFCITLLFLFFSFNAVADNKNDNSKDKDTVLLIVTAKVDPRAEGKDIAVSFWNEDTEKEKGLILYPYNSYSGKVKVSKGRIWILSLMVSGDYRNEFPVYIGNTHWTEYNFIADKQTIEIELLVGNVSNQGQPNENETSIEGSINTENTNGYPVEDGELIDENKIDDTNISSNDENSSVEESVEKEENLSQSQNKENVKKNDKKVIYIIVISVIVLLLIVTMLIIIRIKKKRKRLIERSYHTEDM